MILSCSVHTTLSHQLNQKGFKLNNFEPSIYLSRKKTLNTKVSCKYEIWIFFKIFVDPCSSFKSTNACKYHLFCPLEPERPKVSLGLFQKQENVSKSYLTMCKMWNSKIQEQWKLVILLQHNDTYWCTLQWSPSLQLGSKQHDRILFNNSRGRRIPYILVHIDL